MKKNEGFSIVEIVIAVVVVAVIGAVGWMAYTNVFAPKTDETSQKPTTTATEQVTIEDASDLDKVDETLDDITLEDEDTAELNAATEDF